MMPAEPALADTQKLQIPAELVHALNSRGQKRNADYYGIEALKPSLFGRLIEKLLGPKK